MLDGFNIAALVDGARLDHALDARGALLAALGERAQGHRGIGGHQAQHAVELAILQQDSLAAKVFVVGKDLFHTGDAIGGTLDVDGIGTKVDAHAEAVFHEPKIFIASPEEGLKAWRDVQRFFHQAVKLPPTADETVAEGTGPSRGSGPKSGVKAKCLRRRRKA